MNFTDFFSITVEHNNSDLSCIYIYEVTNEYFGLNMKIVVSKYTYTYGRWALNNIYIYIYISVTVMNVL